MLTRIELAAARTQLWLNALLEEKRSLPLSGHLDLVVLADLCCLDLSNRKHFDCFKKSCLYMAQTMNQLPEAERFNSLLETDVRRVLFAYRALVRAGVSCAPLEEFVRGLARSIQTEGSAEIEMTETVYLCQASGLIPSAPMAAAAACVVPSTLDLLRADETLIQRVLEEVALRWRFGTKSVNHHPQLLEKMRSVIPVWILDFARGYKISKVATALRVLAYVSEAADESRTDTTRFLLDQQNPGGWFGFFGPELARIRNKGSRFDSISELYLPTTLACYWALREATSSFRLTASLRVQSINSVYESLKNLATS